MHLYKILTQAFKDIKWVLCTDNFSYGYDGPTLQEVTSSKFHTGTTPWAQWLEGQHILQRFYVDSIDDVKKLLPEEFI